MTPTVLVVLTGIVLPLLLVGALVVLAMALAARPAPAPSAAAERARRHGTVVNVVAWVLPLTVGTAVLGPLAVIAVRTGGVDGATWNALLAGLYPAIVGLEFLGVHAVGERTWPRPAGAVRRAALVHRRAGDVAPRWIRRLVLGWALAAVVALVAFGLTAAADGRSVHHGSSTASPYPGWDFGVPLLVAVVLVALAAEAVLRLVARRPAIVGTDPAYDAESRRLSAHRALRGAQLVLGATLAGVLAFAGISLQNVGLRPLGGTITVTSLLVALAALVVTLVPARTPAAVPPAAPTVPMMPTGPTGLGRDVA